MNLAIFQLPIFPLKEEKLTSYLKVIPKGSIVIFGEYVLNPFFHQNLGVSKESINRASENKLMKLSKFAKKYNLHIVAPILCGDSKKIYKKIAIVDEEKIDFYMQQKLIHYPHWNEAAFFANPKVKSLKLPYIFEKDDLKIAVLFGFELHFDEIWIKMKNAGVDVVLLCSASTFDSNERWRDICKARAFVNSCAIIRVNRVGEHLQEGVKWKFYGDSFVAMPNAKIADHLGNQEEILCITLEKSQIDTFVKEWNFR